MASQRKLRLTIRATAALHRRRAEQAAARLSAGAAWSSDERWVDLVFTSELGTPMHPSNVRRSLTATIQRANRVSSERQGDLIPSDFTPYEVGRHTAASLLIDAGASPYQVADQLGHTSTRTLDRHYRHRIAEVVDTAAQIEQLRKR